MNDQIQYAVLELVSRNAIHIFDAKIRAAESIGTITVDFVEKIAPKSEDLSKTANELLRIFV